MLRFSVPGSEQNSVDPLNPFIPAVCVAYGNMANAEVPLRYNFNMLRQLMFNEQYHKVQTISAKYRHGNFIANKSHIETVCVLTDMFCSNQWRRADRKQEIARVQGCSEDWLRA